MLASGTFAGMKPTKLNKKQKVVFDDASGKKITFSSQKRVGGGLQPFVKRVLRVLGYPEAWVSDESRLSDFMSSIRPDRTRDERVLKTKLKNEFNLEVGAQDFVVDVAERLYQRSLN